MAETEAKAASYFSEANTRRCASKKTVTYTSKVKKIRTALLVVVSGDRMRKQKIIKLPMVFASRSFVRFG